MMTLMGKNQYRNYYLSQSHELSMNKRLPFDSNSRKIRIEELMQAKQSIKQQQQQQQQSLLVPSKLG
jgi:hypothetical protein